MIHGGIDRYSRIWVFLRCSANNFASTVLAHFLEPVRRHGLPSRVRWDKGGENVDVSLFMLTHPRRGPGRGSMVAWKSVHNQRIVRLRRDLYFQKTATFFQLFCHMEENTILDVRNEVHMCSLHYIFLPLVNVQLNDFVNGWISHGLSLPPTIEPLDSFGFRGCNRVQHPALLCRKKCLRVSHYSTIDFQLKCVSMKS